MKCPKCGVEMEVEDTWDINFDDEDTIEVETLYRCDNCGKGFKYLEKFKKNSSEFCYEYED